MKNKTKGLIIGAIGSALSMAVASYFEKKADPVEEPFDDSVIDVPEEEITEVTDEEVKEG